MGLYEAYEHCAPFRDAINEVGNVLEGAFKTALTDIENALSTLGVGLRYLWNSILVPIADFFKGAFAEAINFVMGPIDAFESAISKVSSIVQPLDNLLGGLTSTLKSMCFAHAAPAAEEFNKQLTSGIELSNNLTQKLDPLKQGLLGVTSGASTLALAADHLRTSRKKSLHPKLRTFQM